MRHVRAGRLEPRYRRTVWRTIAVTQLVVALATGATISWAYSSLDANFGEGQDFDRTAKKPAIGGDALNILVMGSDSREGAGNAIDGEKGIGQRSDTTILVHVSADRKTVYGVSLPRDAMVERPDCQGDDGQAIEGADLAMFNEAYSVGGPACTATQVDALTGVYIDHYVSLDFAGFKDMVDAIGGVEVCIPEAVDDPFTKIKLDEGTQVLDGDQALNYVRERDQLSSNGDIGRMKRQQAFIASMVNEVVSAGTLTRPDQLYGFLKAATGSIVTDPELASLSQLADLGLQFRKTPLDDITFVTVPIAEYPEDINRLIWTDDAQGLWRVMIADKPLPRRYLDGSISADEPPGTPSQPPSASASPSPSTSPSPSPSRTPSAEPTQNAEAAANGLCA
jgi:LCP family protein required for cell wall assembly